VLSSGSGFVSVSSRKDNARNCCPCPAVGAEGAPLFAWNALKVAGAAPWQFNLNEWHKRNLAN